MNPYYSADGIDLYLGDCREVTAWLDADVLVTDPPYGIGYESGWSSLADSRVKNKPASTTVIHNDESVATRDAALDMWKGRPALVFGVWRAKRPDATRQRLIWHKRNTNPGMGTSPWYSVDEEIYVIGAGWQGAKIQSVIPTDEYRASAHGQAAVIGHPTPKPIALMQTLIDRCPARRIESPHET